MRLFVAIPFSEKCEKYLNDIQNKLPDAKMRLSNHFHITLQFLGHVQPEKVDEIKKQLKEISFGQFNLTLDKLGVFKNPKGYIRVAWIAVSFPEELKNLQTQVEEKLKPLGFEPDKPFKPHLTLARIKFADDKKFEEELKGIKAPPLTETVERMVLFQSHLSRDGAQYENLLEVKAS